MPDDRSVIVFMCLIEEIVKLRGVFAILANVRMELRGDRGDSNFERKGREDTGPPYRGKYMLLAT